MPGMSQAVQSCGRCSQFSTSVNARPLGPSNRCVSMVSVTGAIVGSIGRGDVRSPAAEVGNVRVPALGELAWVEDALDDAAVAESHRSSIEADGFAGLHPGKHGVGHTVQLAVDGDAAGVDLEHARVYVANGVHPIAWRRRARLQKFGAIEVLVQGQPSHERPVDKQLDAHGLATSAAAAATGMVAVSSAGFRTAR